MSQNATPATEFAAWHHFAQRWQCDSQKTRSTIRLKCCACHANWHRRSPKCCACHEKGNASSETSQRYCACHTRQRHETCWNFTKYHACHAKSSYTTRESSKREPFCRTSHRHGHSNLARTVANGCGRLRTLGQRLANTAQPPWVKREPLLRIREKTKGQYKGWQRQWTHGVTGVPRNEDSERRTKNIREMLVDTSDCSQRNAGAFIHYCNKMIMCCHAFLGWLFIQSSCVSLHWSPAASYIQISVSGLLPSLFLETPEYHSESRHD